MTDTAITLLVVAIVWVVLAVVLLIANPGATPMQLLQRVLAGAFFLLVSLAVVAVFLVVLGLLKPKELAILGAKCLSGGNLLDQCRGGTLMDFADVVTDTMRIASVQRMDTDGDGFKEWVALYYYDIYQKPPRGPIAGAIYDNDRGWPPVLFPYQLRLPDRDYLGEGSITIEQFNVVEEPPAVPELLVRDGDRELSIFHYNKAALTEAWKPPEDRMLYFPIGVFRGDRVSFDKQTRQVTVWDQGGFAVGAMAGDRERSQLTNKRVYSLIGGSYMNPADVKALNAPMESSIDFNLGWAPADVLSTQYPEKIVLGFYKTMGGEGNGADPEGFLTGEALQQYQEGRLDYFGIPWSENDSGKIWVTQLGYSTKVEEQEAEITAQGVQPLRSQASVTFVLQPKDQPTLPTPQSRTWVLVSQEGKWKMEKRK
jgi:hypothetical protein